MKKKELKIYPSPYMLQTVDLLKKVHTIDPKTWKEYYKDMYFKNLPCRMFPHVRW